MSGQKRQAVTVLPGGKQAALDAGVMAGILRDGTAGDLAGALGQLKGALAEASQNQATGQ